MFIRTAQLPSRRILVVVISTIVVVALCVSFVFMLSSRRVEQAKHDAFLTTSAFAQLVANWLTSEKDRQQERVLSAAEAMLLGNHGYIKVAYHGDTIVETRSAGWDHAFFPPSAMTNSMVQRTEVSLLSAQGWLMIDAIVPLPGAEGAGNLVRVRIHAVNLEEQIRSVKLTAVVAGFVSWLILLAIALYARKPVSVAIESSKPLREAVDSIVCGPLQIHTKRKTISLDGNHVAYPPKLFHLLELLALEQDKAFSADEILQHVWTDAQYANANDVRQCVYRLRRRLNEQQEGLGDCITNVKGFGYRFDTSALSDDVCLAHERPTAPHSSSISYS